MRSSSIKNVLAPIDFSPRSLEALETALAVSKRFGAESHLAHIYEPDFPLTTVMAMPLALPPVQVAPGEIRAKLPARAPDEGEPFANVVRDLDEVLLPGITHWQHPRYFAYFATSASDGWLTLTASGCRGFAVAARTPWTAAV